MPTPTFTVHVLGRPHVAWNDQPLALSPSVRHLCAYLALAPPEGRPRDVVAGHLFGGCDGEAARRRLNTTIWRLRRSVRSCTGVDLVRASTHGAAVAFDPRVRVTTDAAAFADMVVPVLHATAMEVDAAKAAQLETAVALHHGQLLESCQDEWVLADRYRIERLYLGALDYLLQYYGDRAELGAVSKYGELALELEPLREDVHRHLMIAYGAVGRRDLVEQQFERCRRLLIEELGADPLPETIAVYSRLMRELDVARLGAGAPAERCRVTLDAMVRDLEEIDRELAAAKDLVSQILDHWRESRE